MAKPEPHSVNQGVDTLVSQTTEVGLTRITVHSPSGVIAMSPAEQKAWFDAEWEKGNPVIRRLAEVALEIAATNSE